MRRWLSTKKRPFLVAAFALLAAVAAIFVQTAPSQAVQAPTNITAPTISANQITFGYAESKVITVTQGTWTDSPTSVTDQWYRCTSTLAAGTTDPTNCQIITGETGLTHTITASDVGFYLMVKETATNSQGSSYTYSETTTKIARSHVLSSATQDLCYINAGKVYCAGSSATGGLTNGSLWANGGFGTLGRDYSTWQGPAATYDGTVLTDVVSLEGSRAHMCAITRTGSIYCTGMNVYGALGDGVAGGQRSWFTQMKASSSTFVTGAVDIAVGDATICFSKADGSAWCNGWGNTHGMLGDNNALTHSTLYPTQVLTTGGAALTGVIQISGAPATTTNTSSFCAVTTDGTTVGGKLFCWGINTNGVLGDGTTVSKLVATPITVNSSTTGFTAVAIGDDHTCAVQNGGAFCWGTNASGQLGNGGTTNSLTPVTPSNTAEGVSFASGVVAVAAADGNASTCFTKQGGAVYCVGANTGYTLNTGNAATISTAKPAVSWTSGTSQVEMSVQWTCAFKPSTNTISCVGSNNTRGAWGQGNLTGATTTATTLTNISGQIGPNATAPAVTTTAITGNNNVGDVLTEGSIWTGFPKPALTYQWYQCSSAVTAGASVPGSCSAIPGATDSTYTVQAGDLGNYITAQVTATNDSGTTSSMLTQSNPVGQLPTASVVPNVTAPASSAGIILNTTLTVSDPIWGAANPTGTTSYKWFRCATTATAESATTIPSGCKVISGATANSYTTTKSDFGFFLRAGQAYTSTAGTSYAISAATTQVRASTSITAQTDATCAVRLGKVFCWGASSKNSNPNLDGTNNSSTNVNFYNVTPTPVVSADGSDLTDVVQVASSSVMACAIKVNRSLWCWGNNVNSGAGYPYTLYYVPPTKVTTNDGNWAQVATSSGNTCAIDTDGAVWCSGTSSFAGSGDGVAGSSTFRKSTTLTSGFIQIVGSTYSSLNFCALKNTGAVYCWGDNANGQLGNGNTTGNTTATIPTYLESGVTSISMGQYGSCAIKNEALWCWGNNDSSMFGVNPPFNYSPFPVSSATGQSVSSGLVAVNISSGASTGSQRTCVISNAGAVYCAGENTSGQLNIANTTNQTTFVATRWTSGVTDLAGSGSSGTLNLATCAIKDQAIYCAGGNGNVGLALGTSIQKPYVVANGPVVSPTLNNNVGVLDLAPVTPVVTTTQNYAVGQNVTATVASEASPAATLDYQWFSCTSSGIAAATVPGDCTEIPGANSTSYTVVAGDLGNYLRVFVTATNVNGSATQASAAALVGTSPTAVSAPAGSISFGPLKLLTGTTLTAPLQPIFTGTPTPTASTQWYHCYAASASWTTSLPTGCYPADGGTNQTYITNHSDDGFFMLVAFTGSSSAGSVTYYSPTTARQTLANKIAMSGNGGVCVIRIGKVYCWGHQGAGGALGAASVYASNGFPVGTQAGDIRAFPKTPVKLASGLPLTDVVSIAMGLDHTCAVTYSGGLYCWGLNGVGQLGDGTMTNRYTAAPVLSAANTPLTGVTQVAAGASNTCAIINAGLTCWGGSSATILSSSRLYANTQVTNLTTGVQQVVLGENHACAISNAAVRCFGQNPSGGLGDGLSVANLTPTVNPISTIMNAKPVSLSGGVTNISAGFGTSCAVKLGQAFCWGGTDSSNLVTKIWNTNFQPVPVAADGVTKFDSGVIAVNSGVSSGSVQQVTCATKLGGSVYCAGQVSRGAGSGTAGAQLAQPTLATNLASGVTEMAVGGWETCGIKGSEVWCAGNNGSVTNTAANTLLDGLATVSASHKLLVEPSSNLGISETAPSGTSTISGYAAVGNTLTADNGNFEGTTAWAGTPTPAMTYQWYTCDNAGTTTDTLPGDCSPISGGTATTTVITSDQSGKYLRVGITGTNNFGVATVYSAALGPVGPAPTVTTDASINAPSSPAMNALATISGNAATFGGATDPITSTIQWYRCQTSASTASSSVPADCLVIPTATDTTYKVTQNDTGLYLRMASIGTAVTGQVVSLSPSSTVVLQGATVATSQYATCAVKLGRVYCWGSNFYNQLGTGQSSSTTVTTSNAATPVKTAANTILENIVSVQGSNNIMCAIDTSGALYCWGQDAANHKLGTGSASITSLAYAATPVNASDGATFSSGVVGVTIGNYAICAWRVSGKAYCWGNNSGAAYGDGTAQGLNTARQTPGPVSNLTAVSNLSISDDVACAVNGGGISCWGTNNSGQVVDGYNGGTYQTTPISRSIVSTSATSVAVLNASACAVVSSAVYCVSGNVKGSRGTGTTLPGGTSNFVYSYAPQGSPLTDANVTGIFSHGYAYTACVTKTDGNLYCWGDDTDGAVPGISKPASNYLMVPTESSITNVEYVSMYAQSPNTFCVVASGALSCTGSNANYVLGNGTTTNSVAATAGATPAMVPAAGFASNLGANYVAVTLNSPVVSSSNGQFVGSVLTVQAPTAEAFPTPTTSIKWLRCNVAGAAATSAPSDCVAIPGATSTSYTITAADTGYRIRAAYFASNPQSSLESYSAAGVPVSNTSFSNFVRPFGGGDSLTQGETITRLPAVWKSYPAVTTTSGWLRCGSPITVAQIGIPSQCDVISGATGNSYTLVTEDTANYIASYETATNATGSMTVVSQTSSLVFGQINTVAVSYASTCAIKQGNVYCSGANTAGQLGNGGTTVPTTPFTPSKVKTSAGVYLSNVVSIYSSKYNQDTYCALTSLGSLYCWGADSSLMQLMSVSGGSQKYAIQLLSGLKVAQVSLGFSSMCAVTEGAAGAKGGALWCWGNENSYSMLGDGGSGTKPVGSKVQTFASGVSHVDLGMTDQCAIVRGAVYCWGGGYTNTQTAMPNKAVNTLPTLAAGLTSGVTKIAIGATNGCAVKDGALLCWGYNGYGQLANGTLTTNYTPTQVSNATDGTSLASGVANIFSNSDNISQATSTDRFCALKTSGAVYCWGNDSNFGVTFTGVATSTAIKTATPALTLTSGVTSVAMGYQSSCAVKSGALYCAGPSSAGNYGRNMGLTGGSYTTPTAVAAFTNPNYTASLAIAPTIPSAAALGTPINVDTGVVTGYSSPSYTYAWYTCDAKQLTTASAVPSGCVAATGTGATANRYVPVQADFGKYLVSMVSAVNAAGTTTVYTASTDAVGSADQYVTVTGGSGTMNPGVTVQLSATATSGLTDFTWASADEAICTVDSTGLVTPLGGGHCIITATQAGNSYYKSATGSLDTLSTRGNQTISWPDMTNTGFSATPITLAATSTSRLTLTYASSTPSVCTVAGNLLTTVSLGSCSLTSDQAGNTGFFPADQAATTFEIVQGANVITLTGGNLALEDGTKTLPLTASSALNVTYSTNTSSSICSVSGNTLTLSGVGRCVVTASQAGDTNFVAATDVTATYRIVSAPESDTQVTISGTPVFGVSYGSTAGTWTSVSSLTTGYQWYSCTSAGDAVIGAGNLGANAPSDCTAITGATSASFTPTVAEVGTRLRLAEQASNVTAGTTNYYSVFSEASPVVQKQSQTITFTAFTSKTYGDAAVTLAANSDRSLSVSYSSSDTSVCTISGTTLTIVGAGSCDVTASQSGSASTLAATSVVQTLTVAKANQTITFALGTQQKPAGDFAAGGTTTSGLTISYSSSTTSVCTVSGSTVTPVGLGTCTITASQAGDANYNAATSVSASFTIESVPVPATMVSIPTAANYRFGVTIQGNAGTWGGNNGSSTRAWYRCDTAPSITNAVGTAAANAPANCTAIAGAINEHYTPVLADIGKYLSISETATNTTSQGTNYRTNFVSTATVVEKQTQTLTFAALANATYGDAAITLGATSDRSLTISYASSNTSVCTISGSQLTVVAPGTCDVTASQAGNSTTLAATSVVRTLTVLKANQTITLPDFTAGVYLGADKVSGAIASSGLTVTLTSSTPVICTVSGLSVVQVIPGTCTITASQAGDSNYNAATDVTKSFTIAKAAQTITLPNFTAGVYQGANKVSGATASSGLTVTLTSTTTAVCTVSGLSVVQVTAGTCSITASQAGDSNWLAATDVTKTFTIAKAAQTISFTGSAKQKPAGTFTLAASTNSGLTISYTSTTTSVCTVSGAVVTPVTLGTCTITASQAGDSNWSAATSVNASFTIESVPVQSTAVSISSAANYRFGTAVTLSAGGTWTGTATITQSKAWYRCDTAPAISAAVGTAATLAPSDCVAIAGASGVSYTPVAADIGKYLAIADTATNTTTSGGTANRTTFVATATTVEKQTQTITFAALTSKTYGNASFNLTATTDRSLTVSFASSNTSVCTISGIAVTITGAGTCDITASQAGSSTTLAATDVVRTLTVSKAAQTITFTGSPKQFGAGDFTLAATTTAGLAISYASTTTSVCTVSGSIVTPVTLGTCTITASQAGDTNYNAATSVNASFTIESVPTQSSSVAIPSAAHYRFGTAITALAGSWTGTSVSAATRTWYRCVTAPAINAATGSASALKPVDCTLISGATGLTYTPVLADIGNYLATAEAVTNTTSTGSNARTTFVATAGVVEKQTQTLTFTRPNDGTFGDADQTLVASTDRSLAVSLSSTTPSVCSVTGTTLRFLKSGNCQVWANQAGNSTTEAATQTGWTIAVAKAAQTVALTSIADQTYAPARTVSATTSATSALTPTLTSNDTDVCTVSGVVISLVKSGTCSITASQAGDDRYSAATSVTKTFQIAKANQNLTFTIDSYVSLGEAAALDLTGTVNSGLTIDYTVSDETVCKVQNGKLAGLIPGQCSVTASQAGDDRYNPASVTRTLQVGNYVTVVSMDPIGSAITNSTTTGFTVTFDSAITGFTAADLTTVPSGVCTVGEPASVNGDAAVYSVALTNCGNGSVVLKLAVDSVSNGAPGPKLETVGTVPVVFDRVFSQTVTVTPQFTSPTNRSSLVYNVTFAEAVTGFSATDVSFSGTGAADCSAVVTGSGTSYVVTVTGCVDGTVKLAVAGSSVTDLAGNVGPTADTYSSEATVDVIAPAAPEASGLPETYTRSTEVTVSFPTDSANTYHCSLNGVELTGCDGSLVIPATSLTGGDYTVEVWATDAAGNNSTHFSHTFTVGSYAKPAAPVINASAFDRTAFNHLTINWSLAAAQSTELPVTGIKLEYSTDGLIWTTVDELPADATSYDLVVQSGKVYSFRLRALSGPFEANASDLSTVETYTAIYQPTITAQSTNAALQKPASGTAITLTGVDLRNYANLVSKSTTGTVVTVTDAAGKSYVAKLVSVTSTSIRFTVPSTSKVGMATVKVTVGSGNFIGTSATRNINIVSKKANQVITFTPPTSTRVAADDIQMVASMNSTITPKFVIEPGSIGICTVSTDGLLHSIKGGVCSFKVVAAGADAYNSFTSPVYSTPVIKLNVSMAFELPTELTSAFNQDGKLLLNPDLYQLTAVADASIPNTTVSVVASPETTCFIDGELKLHVISIGVCTITALAENDFYRTQAPIVRAFEVVKSVQTLTYIAPGTTLNGVSAPPATDSISGFQLVATLNSGNLPNFAATNSNICTVDPSGMVSWVSDLVKTPNDICEITITQAGDANYYGIEPTVVRFGATHVPPLPPIGGYVREPDGSLAVGRTGGLAASGNEGVAVVVVTGSKIAITPFSRGVYIGPITATVTIPYYVRVKNVLTYKQQTCTIKFGILKKYRVGDPNAFKVKDFPNKKACTANKDVIAWFKTGARLLPTIVVKRDRKWPTTYLAKSGNNGKGAKIWPRIKTWHLTIG